MMPLVPKRFHSDGANTSMCDKYGKLQFYTNGCVISNRLHEAMDNGEIQKRGRGQEKKPSQAAA